VQLLLDTHIFLWLVNGNPRLNAKAKALINSADAVFVSSATMWEMAIKIQVGKLRADLDELLEQLQANGFQELPVYARHAKELIKLPRHHSDPFDRLLVAQAISETIRLLTADPHLKAYSDLVECA
jgi:PIN domain nuclease of toxin-antitoxin system